MSAEPASRLSRSPALLADVQLCIRAMEMRARHMRFTTIAKELGLANARAAQEAVKIGLQATPAEDVRDVRRMCADELHEMARHALEIIDDPGPLTSATGKLIINPDTGETYPDNQARTAALRMLLEVNVQLRKLYGADAPKQSIHAFTVMSADEIRAEAARIHAEAVAAEQAALRVIPGEIEAPPSGTDG